LEVQVCLESWRFQALGHARMLEISAFYEGTTKEQAKYNKCKQEIEEIFILAGRVHE